MRKVIIYDKDGTLMKFDPFWVPVARHALYEIFLREVKSEPLATKLTEKAEKAAGVENGKADPNGVLCSGTYSRLAEIVTDILIDAGFNNVVTQKVVETAMNGAVKYGEILPCRENLREKLIEVKRFADLFVVTTDEPSITETCLKKLGIYDLFEKIYCDDENCPHKPDPFAAEEIEKSTGVARKSVYMIGDTSTDCEFAEKADINFISVGTCKKITRQAVYNAVDAVEATEYVLSQCVRRNKPVFRCFTESEIGGFTGEA